MSESEKVTHPTTILDRRELPGNWQRGSGASSRPISEGGYYDKWFHRVLPGSNQHVERYLELHIYAEKDRHVVELQERIENDIESREVSRLTTLSFNPKDRDSEKSHRIAERRVARRALRLMRTTTGYTPDQ